MSMENKKTDTEKLNEATALLDESIKHLHAAHRMLARYQEDAELLNEHIAHLIDEYDLWVVNLIDGDDE